MRALALLFALAAPSMADSLWVPSFAGYITPVAQLRVGDLVHVEISASARWEFRSVSSGSRSLSLDSVGGGQGALLSFIPSGTSEADLATEGEEEYELAESFEGRFVHQVEDQPGKSKDKA